MNWRSRKGLTLMELLVALSLLAVILAALVSTTNFGVRMLDRTQDLQASNPQNALRLRLRHWMRTAIPPSQLVTFPATFTGTTSDVQFTTLGAAPFAPNSAALRITIDAVGDEMSLRVEELDDEGTTLADYERVLATNLSNGQIRYYGTAAGKEGWHDEWDDPGQLPILISITADPGSTPPWPEFTVRFALGR